MEEGSMRAGGPRRSTFKFEGRKLVAVGVVSLLLAAAGAAQDSKSFSDLPNFYKVNERLYRGGQPKAGGVKKLAELGIKTIINLRGADEVSHTEEAEAKAAGLAYFNVPMPGLSRPSPEQVARVMALIEAEENWPVFLHCKRGADRTGTIISIYRISHEDWTADKAMSEAKRFGMSWLEFGMRDFISDYHRELGESRQRASQKLSAEQSR